MKRATAELLQARDTISMQSKEMAKIAKLRSSLNCVEDNVDFYDANEHDLKSELAASIKQSTRTSQLFDYVRDEAVDLRERLGAKMGLFGQSLKIFLSPGPSLRGLVEYFRSILNK